MSVAIAAGIGPHVDAAKRLLEELEAHAEAAMESAARGNGSELLASLQQRDALLAALGRVASELAHARAQSKWAAADPQEERALHELDMAAGLAMAAHEELVVRTQQARDRLQAALDKAEIPDTVADQYTATTSGTWRPMISVRG